MIRVALSCLLGLLISSAAADELQEELDDHLAGPHWLYNDLDGAIATARQAKKPLLVMFRCVPCNCAESLDQDINRQENPSEALQKQFVCVRIVHMRGVDLSRFQFDYDVSLVAIFMNADGAIYGRYGTRATLDRKANTHVSLASFQKAMERALAIHAEYPKNKQALAGKQPLPVQKQRPEDFPYLAKEAQGEVTSKNCIHCHMVGEALLNEAKKGEQLTTRDLWRFPLPDNLGTALDVDDGLSVKKVREKSPAARADVRAGDRLLSMNGQPLVSQADIQWILHHLPDKTQVQVELQRGAERLSKTIALAGNWRRADLVWRASLHPLRPHVHLRTVSHSTNKEHGIPLDRMALAVYYPTGPAAQAGLRNNDLVIAIDGNSEFMREGEFLDYLYLGAQPKKQVTLTIKRGKGEPQQIVLPVE